MLDRYRDLYNSLVQVRGDVREAKPNPEVVVTIDGLSDLQKDTIAELLGNPNLEFKISAVSTPNGKDIQLHIRSVVNV